MANAIREPLNLGGRMVNPSASIGVAWSSDDSVGADTLIARADKAMYVSKSGRQGQPILNEGSGRVQ